MYSEPIRRTDEFVNQQLTDLPLSMKYKEIENHFYMDFHSHQGYEIYFFEEGSGYFLIEDQIYPLEGMDIILISPNESHKSSPKIDIPNMRSVIHFLPGLLDIETRDVLLEMFHQGLNRRHLRLGHELLGRFQYLLDRLNEEYTVRSNDGSMALRIYMSELLLELRRYLLKVSVTGGDPVDRRSVHPKVEQAVKMISNRYEDHLTLEEISNKLFLNPYYLSHLFKKTIGITMTEFLLQTRIHHAKQMLLHTQLPISEIAGKVGFNSFSYFGKTFKSYTGATPRDYRKNKSG